MANAAPAEVIRYYAEKTPHILAKYGPGPRVHYHTGFGPASPVAVGSGREARRLLARAQERLLGDSIRVWGRRVVSGWKRILDVGCGLGGPAIFLAERTGAAVIDALTNVPDHIAVIHHFAAAARVAGRVRVRFGDACGLEVGNLHDGGDADAPPEPYDAAIALDSSCYLDRTRWFACLGRVLGRDATVHIVDYFAGRPEAAADFDARWLTRIGWFDEYLIKGGWQDKFKELPRVFVTAHETEQ